MPQAVAAVIIAVGAAAGVAVPAGIATFAGNLIVLGGLTALQLALKPSVPKPPDGNLPARQDMPPRGWMFGRGRKSGALVFQEVAEGGVVYSIYALADDLMDAIESHLLHEDVVTLTADGLVYKHPISKGYAVDGPGRVQILTRQGLPTETAYADVIAKFPDLWGPNDRGDGVASLMMRCASGSEKTFPDLYPYGHPQPSVIGRWALCWDPRGSGQSPDDPSTWTWTRNPIVQLLRFVCFHPHGYQRDWRKAYLPTADLWIAAMEICDERVPLAGGGTIERYASGGGFDSETERKAVAEELMRTCDGWFTEAGDGSWVVFAGKLYEPTFEIGPENIIGMSLQRGVPTEDRAEALVVTFTSPDHKYATVECDAWGEAAITAEGRLPQRAAVEAKWTQHFTQARRLAKREDARRKAKARGTLTTDLYGLNALRHRYIRVRWPMFASTADIWVEVRKLTISLKSSSVLIEWVKVDPTVDAWDPALEEGARPPIPAEKVKNGMPAAPSPTLVQLPGAIIQASLPPVEEFADGDLGAIGQYRKAGETAWRRMTSPDLALTVLSEPVVDGVWEAQAAYTDGRREGPWSPTATISVDALLTPPGDPTALTAVRSGTTVILTARANSTVGDTTASLEFRRGAIGASPYSMAPLGAPVAARAGDTRTFSDTDLLPGVYDYCVFAENDRGVPSAGPAGPVTVTAPGTTFSDDFERADGSPGSSWTLHGNATNGTIAISSGNLSFTVGTGGGAFWSAPDTNHLDHFARVSTAFSASLSSFILVVRGVDENNMGALVRWTTTSGGRWEVFKKSLGSLALLSGGTVAQTTVPPDGTDVQLEAVGDNAILRVNGTVVLTVAMGLASNPLFDDATLTGVFPRSAQGVVAHTFSCGVK